MILRFRLARSKIFAVHFGLRLALVSTYENNNRTPLVVIPCAREGKKRCAENFLMRAPQTRKIF